MSESDYDAQVAQERTGILLGRDGLAYLAGLHIAVVGLGGVGGAAAEAVARAGIGRMTVIDHDHVGLSNMNRQLVCTVASLGVPKAAAMADRLHAIHPALELRVRDVFLNRDNIGNLVGSGGFDYVLDCIDSVSCKAELVAACQQAGVPVASSMGAGGRLDVTQARMSRLADTWNCGLAANLRRRLRRMGASLDYPVVFSPEKPIRPLPQQPIEGSPGSLPRAVNGTISYMPNLFGFMLAGFVIRQLLESQGFPGPQA